MHSKHLVTLLGALIFSLVASEALAQRGQARTNQRQQRQGEARQQQQARTTRPAVRQTDRQQRPAFRRGQSQSDPRITSVKAQMESAVKSNATPVMHLVPARGVGTFRTVRQPHYKNNTTAQIEVSGLGTAGELPLTVLFPASGHLGAQQAQEYAKTNVYKAELQRADGTRVSLPDVKSTGLVTEIAQTLKLGKGTNILRVWPSATSVGGFRPGREVELVWDGN